MASGRAGGRRGKSERVGYAVVGLGHIAQVAVLPAFGHARANSRLVALVSGDSHKREALGRKYGVPSFRYEDLDEVLAREDVDAVYVTLPNSMHKEVAVRAARAGVHVLTEKPMATSEADCREMIRAAEGSDVRLMVAYRLHFEPANLEAQQVAWSGRIGTPRFFTSNFSYQVKEENIRTEAPLGGGAIWDLGVYCINAARYLFRAEPAEVMAMSAEGRGDPRFSEIHEAWSALLRFPEDRLAAFTCSFGANPSGNYRLVCTEGEVQLDPAYEYAGELVRYLTLGEKKTSRKPYRKKDQFAPELLHFSSCVLERREPEPDGWEGLADVRIIEAVLRSAREHRPIPLEPVARTQRPSRALEQRIPPVEKPEEIEVQPPHD